MTSIPTQNTALLVVDMQKAFVDNQYSLGQLGLDVTPLQEAIPGCVKLVEMARAAGIPVIFTRYVYMPGMVDFGLHRGAKGDERLSTQSLGFGTEEIEVIDELGATPEDIIIDKSRPSSFYGTRLEPVLTSMAIRNLVVCGVTTNICVETTVRDAGQRDYGTYVVRDAVAEFTPERNHYALVGMGWSFGEVIETADVATSWTAGAASQAAE